MKTPKPTPAQPVDLTRLVRAFRVEVTEWPEATCVVRTTSPAKAKFSCWASAQSVGYDISFAALRVRRAPEYDGKKSLAVGRNYSLDYAASADSPNDAGQRQAPAQS